MLPHTILEKHYQEYGTQPDSWVVNMGKVKKQIVQKVIDTTGFVPQHEPVNVLVLGASDKRYIPIHQEIFEKVLNKQIKLTTFDIDIAHLQPNNNLVYHDVTKPFPQTSFDIIFSHELIKFIEPENQLSVLKNSFNALAENGLAMHIMHEPSLKGTKELRSWQYRTDFNKLLTELKQENIPADLVTFKNDSAIDWLADTTVLTMRKS